MHRAPGRRGLLRSEAMDTAPPSGSQPLMPDPRRLVGRTVRLLQLLGHTEAVALGYIALAVRQAIARMPDLTDDESGWLQAIEAEARRRFGVLTPPTTSDRSNDHGGHTEPGPDADAGS